MKGSAAVCLKMPCAGLCLLNTRLICAGFVGPAKVAELRWLSINASVCLHAVRWVSYQYTACDGLLYTANGQPGVRLRDCVVLKHTVLADIAKGLLSLFCLHSVMLNLAFEGGKLLQSSMVSL